MDEATAGTISGVFREILEKQVFMFADPARREDAAFAGGGYVAATMGFRGEVDGRVALAVPVSLVGEIAANFLGLDAADPIVVAGSRDACKELLNITCGNMLTALRGEAPVFDLTIPETAEVDAETVADWAARPESLLFEMEGEPVLLMVGFGAPAGFPIGGAGEAGPR
jgi:CheY-specific phosphatase CheX